jgi:ribosomal protein L2
MLPSRLWLRASKDLCSCRHLALPFRPLRQYATTVEEPSIVPSQSGMSFIPPTERKTDRSVVMRTYTPRTPGIRHLKRPINDHLWKGKPHRALTIIKSGHGKGGRNSSGRITVRHRGGGHKRRLRTVDFHRTTPGKHVVERIEYDPGRSGHIALVSRQATGEKSYILAADGLRAGDVVESYRAGISQELLDSMGGQTDPGMLAARTAWRGNCLPLHMIPVGTTIHSIGSQKGGKAVFCRSAGTHATIISKDGQGNESKGPHVTIKLQSGEIRKVSKEACATIGVVSNPHWQYRQLGKAGRSRWLNIRPTVRGVAMNASDHPHGGGRGKSKGNRHPVSPWGMPVSWDLTFIVARRC